MHGQKGHFVHVACERPLMKSSFSFALKMLELENKRLEQSDQFLYLNMLEYEQEAISRSVEHGVNFIEKSLSSPLFPFPQTFARLARGREFLLKLPSAARKFACFTCYHAAAIALTAGCVSGLGQGNIELGIV